MSNRALRTLDTVADFFGALFLALLFWLGIVAGATHGESARCQDQGWDKAEVTWALDVRCVNLNEEE